MIYFYQVSEKNLKEVVYESKTGKVQIIVFQQYLSMLLPGPWMPFGIQQVRVLNEDGEEISRDQWGEDLKTKVKEVKSEVPFQISLFRNLFIFILILAVFGTYNRIKLNQKKQVAIDLTQKLNEIKDGDVFRTVFYDMEPSQIGLIKVVGIDGDTIKFNRSSETKKYLVTEGENNISFSHFNQQEEKVSLAILLKSKSDQHLVTYTTEEKKGEVIGKIIAIQD